MIVWDHKGDPPDSMEEVMCWRSYAQGDRVSSVPLYVEDHAERLRAKFLAFIHDLGETLIDGMRVIDHLDLGDGFSFWWMTQLAEKSPLKSPRIADCLRLVALEEILLNRKESTLTLRSADSDLAEAMWRLCQNLHVSFNWQPGGRSKQENLLRRLYRALPYPAQGLISLRHLVLLWPLRKLQKPQWFSGDSAIFLCSYFSHLDPASGAPGGFFSRLWGRLPQQLHENGRRTNWVHHFLVSRVVPDVQTGLGWLRRLNVDANSQGNHIFLDTYLTWRIVVRVLTNWLRLNAAAWRLRHIQAAFYPIGSAVWLWPMLRNDWLTSLTGPIAISNCRWVALFDAALQDLPHQTTGLYLCENQGWERAMLHSWRKNGHGQIIAVAHATVPFWHLYYFDDPRSLISPKRCAMPLPDRLAVNGTMARRAFADAGYPVEHLAEVEALRYLDLSGIAAGRDLDYTKRMNARSSLPESLRGNVLILGEMTPVTMHQFLRLVEDATRLLPSGYRFTLKPHPAYAVNLADYPDLKANEITDALDRILHEYDIAIAANSTSASVDAYMAGLRVIIGLDGADLNLSPLRGQPDVHFVSTPEALAEALRTAAQRQAAKPSRSDFFFLDPELPRWRKLLGLGVI